MGKIRDLMALELETNSLNQEESAIFDFDRRIDTDSHGLSNEELLLSGKSPAKLHPSVPSSNTSCDSTEKDLSGTQYESTDESDNEASCSDNCISKVCSWDSLESSLQSVFPDDTKYT